MNKLDNFLFSINMHPDQTDIAEVCESFMAEMELGLKGEKSSLQMIPTYINAKGSPKENTPVIAIDAGGTNLRIGLVSFIDGSPFVSRVEKSAMPGSLKEITASDFFDELAEKLLPYTGDSDYLSFCFSYPAKIFPNRDGEILQLNKEVRVKGAEGLVIGKELMGKLKEKGINKDFSFTLLNDTAAGLMGGIATLGLSECDGLSGLILGTGNNSCYFEKGEKIKKLENAEDMIINCESGIFDKVFRGESDMILDRASEIPGDHLLEKMMGGVYHGSVITNTLVLAANEGLLSQKFKEAFAPFTSQELDSFVRGEEGRVSKMCTPEDAQAVKLIVDRSFERAAKLVCANIAALCLHCDGGKTESNPFAVVAEGSSFHNSFLFRGKLDRYIERHINGNLKRHIRICRSENSTLAGAALAALLN